MKRKNYRRLMAVVLAMTMLAAGAVNCYAAGVTADTALKETGDYVYKTVSSPQIGSIGGEWAVMGLARSQRSVPASYYDTYYNTVETYVKDAGGVLHSKKYTEYSRVILALTAIGKDPANVGGYNLFEKLADFDMVTWQGINGPIFALIALDSGNYDIPKAVNGKTQTTRELLINAILNSEITGGGFALSGDTADADITGMALQALAPYKQRDDVNKVIARALAVMSQNQENDGSFAGGDAKILESNAQMLAALCSLGIDPDRDSRFIKNGKTIIDGLLSYYTTGGGFQHTADGSGNNQMSTEQGYYALVSYDRFKNGKNPLYDMTDVRQNNASGTEPGGAAINPEITITIDNKGVVFTESSGAPFIDIASRTQVPLRITMESYGAIVSWENNTKTAIVEKDGIRVAVPAGEKYILRNGEAIKIDTAAQIKDGRTYLPIRAVVEALGGTISWDGAVKTVKIER